MKFGLLYEMETPRPWHEKSEYNVYWEALAQIELADRIGMDYVWEVEHHFLEEYSHSPAPEVFYGAVSQRTKNIRIAHGVRLLPFNFNNPIKVAEQAAVLDIISNGRMELGTGRSTTAQELDGFSVDYDRTRAEVREALEIIVKAWTEEILEFDGKLMKIPPRRVVPKPIQKPHPPMWMACTAPESYEMAGDRGLGVLSFNFNWEQVQKSLASYRKACTTRGDQIPKVPNENFAAVAVCHVCENKEDEAIGIAGARWFFKNVAKLFEPLMAKNKLYSYEYIRNVFALEQNPAEATDAQLKDHDMIVVGDPDYVNRKLESFQKAGVDQVIFFKQAGQIPHQNIMRSLRLIGKHVLPYYNPHRAVSGDEMSLAAAGRYSLHNAPVIETCLNHRRSKAESHDVPQSKMCPRGAQPTPNRGTPVQYNPLSPEVQQNPFRYYAALRRDQPVAWLDAVQCWTISRYDDVDFAIRNPQIFSSARWIGQSLGDLNPAPEVPWMIETDPPDHSRLRKLVSKGFTPRMVSRLEPRIRGIAQDLLATARAQPEADFVRDFSGAFPVIVIAEMLGVEPRYRIDFKRWSDNIVRGTNRPEDEVARAEIRATNAEMREYFLNAIAARRKEPREDLLTALVQAEEERQTLTADEVLAMAMLILLAGNETTMNLLSNTVLTLLAHPAEAVRVRGDRSLVAPLIEEVLRYESPVQIVFRRTTKAVELSGTTIPADAVVFLLIGSANRDERQFPDPDRFDLARDASAHLAFGFGTHFCLGAQLARLEAKVALEELFYSGPSYTVDETRIERINSVLLRGIKHLPVRFAA